MKSPVTEFVLAASNTRRDLHKLIDGLLDGLGARATSPRADYHQVLDEYLDDKFRPHYRKLKRLFEDAR